MWTIFLSISIAVFFLSAIAGKVLRIHDKRAQLLTNKNIFLLGVFLSAWIALYPITLEGFAGETASIFKAVLISAHNAVQLFVINLDFMDTLAVVAQQGENLYSIYSIYFSVIFILAPFITFEFILSFFKNLSAYRRLLSCYFFDMYVFSKLNEKSLTLAQSIRKKDKWAALVFADVVSSNDDLPPELLEGVARIDGICFVKDCANIKFIHHRKKKMEFFLMSTDQSENLDHTLLLVEKYKNRKNTKVNLFDSTTISDVLLSNLESGDLVLRRINDAQLFVYQFILEHAVEMFRNAKLVNGKKQISALIIGLGKYGVEMFKALCWVAQVEGYRLKIDCFDLNPNAEEKMKRICPEIFDEKLNGKEIDGESFCDVKVHSDVDVQGAEFYKTLSTMDKTTQAFISLGSDKDNMQVAVALRECFERMGAVDLSIHPLIFTVV